MLDNFLFSLFDLEGPQNSEFIEFYVLAINIFEQDFIDKFE